jgi:formylglycine-generating enzyme required for sulfatase activity
MRFARFHSVLGLGFIGIVSCLACAALMFAQSIQRDLVFQNSPPGRLVALIIGNNNYPQSPLKNPENDAADLGRLLQTELRFDTEVILNADLRAIDRAVQRFADRLSAGDVGLFYYAGHGIQIAGENYLVPVDFDAKDEADVKYQAYAANRVRDKMRDRGVRLSVLILDACRNNPFRNVRSAGGGLAGMSGAGAFIAFAADEGKTADENPSERNGLFTKHLLQALRQPGLNLDDVFRRVREGVYRESRGTQVPFSYTGVIGDFYFRPPVAAGSDAKPTITPTATVETVYGGLQIFAEQGGAVYVDGLKYGEISPSQVLTLNNLAAGVRRVRVERSGVADEQLTTVTAGQVARLNFRAPVSAPPSADKPASPANVGRGISMEFVRIAPGEFMMGCSPGDRECGGDEKPAHRVRITKAFDLGKYEVTQQQWEAVMGANPSRFKGEQRPVEQVSWNDLQEFLRRLNARGDGNRYRLPTEAEWEYAARAGTTGPYAGNLDQMGWYDRNSGSQTHIVGQKQPNAWGLHDMHGNVWEWAQDWYDGYYGGSRTEDPQGPASGETRVRRGGSWDNVAGLARVSNRNWHVPGFRSDDIGFRCVRDVP